MHPQRNLIEAAEEIVKEQTNMGAVARIGINAVNAINAHNKQELRRDPLQDKIDIAQQRIDTAPNRWIHPRDRKRHEAMTPEEKVRDTRLYRKAIGAEIDRMIQADRNKNVS